MSPIAEVSELNLTARASQLQQRKPKGALLLPLLLLVQLVPEGSTVFTEPEPGGLRGHLLVATSQLHDPPFAKTVIYVVEHGAEGAMGLVINRPMGKVGFAELLRQKGTKDWDKGQELLLYYGGPVELKRGFLLHSTDVMLKTSRVVAGGVAMTMDPAILNSIAEGKGPRKYLFVLGYAGWKAKQLEAEITSGSWFTVEADESLVFAEDPAQTWKRLIDEHVLRL